MNEYAVQDTRVEGPFPERVDRANDGLRASINRLRYTLSVLEV